MPNISYFLFWVSILIESCDGSDDSLLSVSEMLTSDWFSIIVAFLLFSQSELELDGGVDSAELDGGVDWFFPIFLSYDSLNQSNDNACCLQINKSGTSSRITSNSLSTNNANKFGGGFTVADNNNVCNKSNVSVVTISLNTTLLKWA